MYVCLFVVVVAVVDKFNDHMENSESLVVPIFSARTTKTHRSRINFGELFSVLFLSIEKKETVCYSNGKLTIFFSVFVFGRQSKNSC